MSKVDNAATPEVAPKAPSKMELARTLFQTIKGETIAEGDSARKQFIARAKSDIGLTNAGAVTYYNNLRNEDKGGKLYGNYGKKKAAVEAAETTAETTAETAADPVAEVKTEGEAAETVE